MEIDDSLYRYVIGVSIFTKKSELLLCLAVCSLSESKKGSYGNVTGKEQLETTQLIYFVAESQNVSTHREIYAPRT